MKHAWELEVNANPANDPPCEFTLRIKDPATSHSINVLPACKSLDEFRAGVAMLKLELDRQAEEAANQLRAFQTGAASDANIPAEVIWGKMESFVSEEEMFSYFNSFSTIERQRIAEYILTHVSMFKGKGPVFSEHYDSSSHLLE